MQVQVYSQPQYGSSKAIKLINAGRIYESTRFIGHHTGAGTSYHHRHPIKVV